MAHKLVRQIHASLTCHLAVSHIQMPPCWHRISKYNRRSYQHIDILPVHPIPSWWYCSSSFDIRILIPHGNNLIPEWWYYRISFDTSMLIPLWFFVYQHGDITDSPPNISILISNYPVMISAYWYRLHIIHTSILILSAILGDISILILYYVFPYQYIDTDYPIRISEYWYIYIHASVSDINNIVSSIIYPHITPAGQYWWHRAAAGYDISTLI